MSQRLTRLLIVVSAVLSFFGGRLRHLIPEDAQVRGSANRIEFVFVFVPEIVHPLFEWTRHRDSQCCFFPLPAKNF